MHDGQRDGIDEHSFVDVLTSPDDVLVVCVPVQRVVQEREQHVGLLQQVFVVNGENLSFAQEQIHFVHVEEFHNLVVVLIEIITV